MTTIALSLILLVLAAPAAFGGAGGSGAPWYPDDQYFGRTEYDGKLYIVFNDTGKKSIPGGIGNQTQDPTYREYVVEIQFILELLPKDKKAAPLYFSSIGKTCEASANGGFPVCQPGEEPYNDTFYLPGDYATRVGAALHTFLEETVYPGLCGTSICGFLAEADFNGGTGNAQEVVDPVLASEPPAPPWFWVQPITIVTP
jgi:hypothetical protein